MKPRLLPKFQFQILQKEGKTVPILTVGADEEIATQGFSNDLRNSGKAQIKRIVKIDNEWAINMNTSRYLRCSDVCLSLSTQLHQKLRWSYHEIPRSLMKKCTGSSIKP